MLEANRGSDGTYLRHSKYGVTFVVQPEERWKSGATWSDSVVTASGDRTGFNAQQGQIKEYRGRCCAQPAEGVSRQIGWTRYRHVDYTEWNADDAYATEASDVEGEAREGPGVGEERVLQRLVERLESTPLTASPRHVSRAVRSAGVRLSLESTPLTASPRHVSRAVRSAGVRLSARRVALAARLLASRGSWRRALLLVHWAARRNQSRVDRKVLTSLIAALGWRYPDAVLQAMRLMMSQPSTWPDLPAYRAAAVALGRAGYLQELLQVGGERMGMGNVDSRAEQLMQDLREGPTRTNRTAPLETDGRGAGTGAGAGAASEASSTSSSGSKSGAAGSSWLAPDVVVYNAVSAAAPRESHPLPLFGCRGQQLAGSRCGGVVYNAVLNACGAKRQWKGVQWVLQQMRCAVLNACGAKRQWKGVQWVLQQMRGEGVAPDAATFGLAIQALSLCNQTHLALQLLADMEAAGFPPTVQTYRDLVRVLAAAGRVEEAEAAVREMQERGMEGNAGVFHALACALCSAGRWQDAVALVEKISRAEDAQPAVVTWTGLIRACERSNRLADAAQVFLKMQKQGCTPNITTCNIMITVFARTGRFAAVEEIYAAARSGGKPIITGRKRWMSKGERQEARMQRLVANNRSRRRLIRAGKLERGGKVGEVAYAVGVGEAGEEEREGRTREEEEEEEEVEEEGEVEAVGEVMTSVGEISKGGENEEQNREESGKEERDEGNEVEKVWFGRRREDPPLVPNGHTFVAMLGACVRCRQWQAVRQVARDMQRAGWPLQVRQHGWVVDALLKGKQAVIADELLLAMRGGSQSHVDPHLDRVTAEGASGLANNQQDPGCAMSEDSGGVGREGSQRMVESVGGDESPSGAVASVSGGLTGAGVEETVRVMDAWGRAVEGRGLEGMGLEGGMVNGEVVSGGGRSGIAAGADSAVVESGFSESSGVESARLQGEPTERDSVGAAAAVASGVANAAGASGDAGASGGAASPASLEAYPASSPAVDPGVLADLVRGLLIGGKTEEVRVALRLVDRMEKEGWVADAGIYTSLLHRTVRLGMGAEAREVLARAEAAGVKVDARPIPVANLPLHAAHCETRFVRCDGCDEMVASAAMDQHIAAVHAPAPCSLCGEPMERRLLPEHESSACPLRSLICPYCDLPVTAMDLQSHADVCGSRTDPCDICSKYVRKREQADHHQQHLLQPSLHAATPRTSRDAAGTGLSHRTREARNVPNGGGASGDSGGGGGGSGGIGSRYSKFLSSLNLVLSPLSLRQSTVPRVLEKLQSFGVAGVLSYGLFNTVYYIFAFLFVFLYSLRGPIPSRLGLRSSSKEVSALPSSRTTGLGIIEVVQGCNDDYGGERARDCLDDDEQSQCGVGSVWVNVFLKVFAVVWAGNQVTNLIRSLS
ncbi:unnamed protein product [Closterium sp. NIES-65]|nr:unnamed protein product [Closterium sp. NIES-65]